MLVPTIHLNGTSRESLLQGYCNAVHALQQAVTAVALACPHGRDYYPQGDGAIHMAMREHEARITKLLEVIKELETIAEKVSDA
jgi:hypothetical protein